jgi:hypothetical protein
MSAVAINASVTLRNAGHSILQIGKAWLRVRSMEFIRAGYC